jgi:outer membrane immunogenic protein
VRKFILGALCAVSLFSAARAQTPSSAFDWSGFYVGVDAGHFWGKAKQTVPGVNAVADLAPSGFTGGAHLGYLWQLNSRFVAGLEADLWALDANDEARFHTFINHAIVSAKWGASLRGIVGITMNPALLYATGGISFIDVEGCGTAALIYGVCFPGTQFSDNKTGWTIGAGLAYPITPQLIARVEYLYADYGNDSYATPAQIGGRTELELRTQTVRVGLSWRILPH